jgi:hypothetical protein
MKRIVSPKGLGGLTLCGILLLCGAPLALDRAWAQSPAVTQQAQSLIDARYRGEVLFIRGKGTPGAIASWTYFFYDPTAPNDFREVRIVDGKVDTFQPADLHRSAVSTLVFDPALNPVPVESALRTAQDYAAKNQITYNQTRVLLRRPAAGQAPAWRVEMLQDGRARGVVTTDPGAAFVKYDASSGDGGPHTAAEFGDDVKDTFLGIGGDLEQFFTGKRTVDQ